MLYQEGSGIRVKGSEFGVYGPCNMGFGVLGALRNLSKGRHRYPEAQNLVELLKERS